MDTSDTLKSAMRKSKGVKSTIQPEPKGIRKKIKIKTVRKYDNAALQKALKAIDEGMPVSTAAKLHNIPRTTLVNKNRGIFLPRLQTRGPECILGVENESNLVKWMLSMSENGFPVTRVQLLDSVQLLLKHEKKKTVFKNNRPGRHWYDAFRTRHSKLSEHISQNPTHSRASVTKEKLRSWHDDVQLYLESNQLLDVHPSRLFNCDELAFFLSPKDNTGIVKKGERTEYNFIQNDEKECLTTFFCANADGIIAPPMVVFTYQRIPGNIAANMPRDWSIGQSENGWMNGESFYEYITKIFYPWLVRNAVAFPVVLFLDGHSSHLTMALSDFCKENLIELVALYPNAQNLQPLAVAFFHPLKIAWTNTVCQWRMENNGLRIRREMFAKLLQSAIDSMDAKEILKNGFKETGFYPLLANGVHNCHEDFKNTVESEPVAQAAFFDNEKNTMLLALFEAKIDKEILRRFQDVEEEAEWNGETRLEGLFYFWRQIKRSINPDVDNFCITSNSVVNGKTIVDENAISAFRHGIFG